MIPIVALSNLVSAVVATVITIVIGVRLRTTLREDPIARDFLVFFSLLSLFFWLLAAPGIFVKNPMIAGYTARIANALIMLAAAYFLAVPLRILGMNRINKFLIPFVFLFAALLFAIDLYFYNASELKEFGNFLIYNTRQQPVVRTLEGIIAMSVALIGSIFFFVNGRRLAELEDRKLKLRAYFLGFGMLLLMIAALLNYIIFTISFNPAILFVSSIAALVGLITMGGGILIIKPV